MCACENIDESERYIQMEAIETKRNVLLEDFTGQNCPNCPKAHETAEILKEQFGDALITVSIHAGPFAWAEGTKSFPTFKTTEGDTYASAWDISEYPSGVINRTSGKLSYSDWATHVRNELQKDAAADIQTEATLNEDKTQLSITTAIKPQANIDGKLQVWITESGIISRQKNGSSYIKEYEHNHVYRASVNGVGGEDISLKSNVFKTLAHTFDIKEGWNADNLSVVTFIYNNSGVVQVTECKVTYKSTTQTTDRQLSTANRSASETLCGGGTKQLGDSPFSARCQKFAGWVKPAAGTRELPRSAENAAKLL